jgi:hypothetical protein
MPVHKKNAPDFDGLESYFNHTNVIPYSVETTTYINLGSLCIVLTKIPDNNNNFNWRFNTETK